MDFNLLLDTDSYKASHWLQYPPHSSAMGAYLESRGGEHPVTLFFGLQYLLQAYLSQTVSPAQITEAAEFYAAHGLPFNQEGWMGLVQRHGGRLPLRIRAVAEGSLVPTGNVLLTVESTDAEAFWLVSWVETLLLRVWYPMTVATRSWHLRQVLQAALEQTADDPAAELDFKLHDFGARGVSSRETAGIGGMAHLVNFQGSDTVQGIIFANRYYACRMAGFSIPAAEHSTITAWGEAAEVEAYRNMLHQFAHTGSLLAVVSDSYDLWQAVDRLWGEDLRQAVIDSGATVVIRPDSGDPVEVVPELLSRLEAKFGSQVNRKGYRVLNHVRVIQGDGVTMESLPRILAGAIARGFSISNLAFGMGGGLLQHLNRDTQKFAYKCCWIERQGQLEPIQKRPSTDPGKHSKAGYLDLIREGESYRTVRCSDRQPHPQSCLETVFENGVVTRLQTLNEIRAIAQAQQR